MLLDAQENNDTAAAAPAPKTIEEQRLDIIRYGTETEIANLIQILKNEKVSYLDTELIEIARNTRNRSDSPQIMRRAYFAVKFHCLQSGSGDVE